MTRSIATTAALAALAASACAVGPEYRRPEVPVPESYRGAEVSPKEAATIADLPWWEVHKDPVLQGLIREALQQNADLALAAARVQEAAALVGVSRADLWPQVNGQVDATYGRQSRVTYPGATDTGHITAALGLSWELDIWGRVRNASDAARANLLSTEEARRAVVLTLVSSVASGYWQLRELDLELEIARRNTVVRQGTVDLFQKRSEGGYGSDLELWQSRADLAVTAAAIPDTERQIALVEHQLCVLLGRAPGPIARGAELTGQPLPPELPTGVPGSLIQRRPDLLSAEQALISATKQVGVARADRLPRLSLTGLIGLDSTDTSKFFTSDAGVWSVGGSLLVPIFQGGRLKSLEEAAGGRMEQAVAIYRSAVLTALREVSDSAVSYRKVQGVRAQYELQVRATQSAERLARMRYEGGVSNYLEVLDAQRQSYTAELSLARTQLSQMLYVLQLYRALGGGWQEQPQATEGAPAQPASTAQPAPAG